jgi:hypothetical protein
MPVGRRVLSHTRGPRWAASARVARASCLALLASRIPFDLHRDGLVAFAPRLGGILCDTLSQFWWRTNSAC